MCALVWITVRVMMLVEIELFDDTVVVVVVDFADVDFVVVVVVLLL